MFDMKDVRKLRGLDRDDLLDLVGLQRSSSTDWIVPTLSAFSVGLLVGAGIGLLLAQKPGAELRDDLKSRLSGAADEVNKTISSAATNATAAVDKIASSRT